MEPSASSSIFHFPQNCTIYIRDAERRPSENAGRGSQILFIPFLTCYLLLSNTSPTHVTPHLHPALSTKGRGGDQSGERGKQYTRDLPQNKHAHDYPGGLYLLFDQTPSMSPFICARADVLVRDRGKGDQGEGCGNPIYLLLYICRRKLLSRRSLWGYIVVGDS